MKVIDLPDERIPSWSSPVGFSCIDFHVMAVVHVRSQSAMGPGTT